MAITKIHGYQRRQTSRSDQAQKSTIVEHVLVEMDNPLDSLKDLVDDLPSVTSGPGTVALNPLQITFTLNQSRHADYTNYVFENLGNGRRAEGDDRFWILPITYTSGGTGVHGVGTSIPKEKRKDQKVAKPDSPAEADNAPITNPTSRPAIFSGSSKIVMRQSLFDLDGNIIKHTNGLPITSPVPISVSQKTWTWEWNIAASSFDPADFDELDNKTNSDTINLAITGDFYPVAAGKMKCMGFSYKEVWETPDGSTTEFHFVRVTGTFEISVDPWDNPPVSLHTKAYVDALALGPVMPIETNAAGDKAKTPWPLTPTGHAISYTDLPTAVEADFGVLQSDGSDLVMVESTDFSGFFTTHRLKLPRTMN